MGYNDKSGADLRKYLQLETKDLTPSFCVLCFSMLENMKI